MGKDIYIFRMEANTLVSFPKDKLQVLDSFIKAVNLSKKDFGLRESLWGSNSRTFKRRKNITHLVQK
jgi:hypothetical protein